MDALVHLKEVQYKLYLFYLKVVKILGFEKIAFEACFKQNICKSLEKYEKTKNAEDLKAF